MPFTKIVVECNWWTNEREWEFRYSSFVHFTTNVSCDYMFPLCNNVLLQWSSFYWKHFMRLCMQFNFLNNYCYSFVYLSSFYLQTFHFSCFKWWSWFTMQIFHVTICVLSWTLLFFHARELTFNVCILLFYLCVINLFSIMNISYNNTYIFARILKKYYFGFQRMCNRVDFYCKHFLSLK